MASSSAHKQLHLHLPNPYGNTAAPPPTPSAHNSIGSGTSDAPDVFSCLLHRLTPALNLSLPERRSSPPTTTVTPQLISFSDTSETLRSNILSASSNHGFFQLTQHSIPSQLAQSADSDASSLFKLSRHEKRLHFPRNWPLGYDVAGEDDRDDDDDEETTTSPSGDESFCLDPSHSAESTELNLTSLREFTAEMEKLGREVVEALSDAYGFTNPARNEATRLCPLMWLSQVSAGNTKPETPGRIYPYVASLQYQMRCQKYLVLTDSGQAAVSAEVDSVLVTLGDIAQVWSNGKIKKVRGRPVLAGSANSEKCISMIMLITLPLESTVSPLLPKLVFDGDSDGDGDNEINHEDNDRGCSSGGTSREDRIFNSFSFEDYAWRIYHERLPSKDPLIRYQI